MAVVRVLSFFAGLSLIARASPVRGRGTRRSARRAGSRSRSMSCRLAADCAELELARAGDHLAEYGVEGELVLAGRSGHHAPDLGAMAAQEGRGRGRAARALLDRREEAQQVLVVGARGEHPVARAPGPIVVAERRLDAVDRVRLRAFERTGGRLAGELVHQLVDVAELAAAPASPGTCGASGIPASARRRRSRRSPRRDGSGRTSSAGGRRSAGCRGSAGSSRGRARARGAEELAPSLAPMEAEGVLRSRGPASWRSRRRHSAAVPPSTSRICWRSRRLRRGWAR